MRGNERWGQPMQHPQEKAEGNGGYKYAEDYRGRTEFHYFTQHCSRNPQATESQYDLSAIGQMPEDSDCRYLSRRPAIRRSASPRKNSCRTILTGALEIPQLGNSALHSMNASSPPGSKPPSAPHTPTPLLLSRTRICSR